MSDILLDRGLAGARPGNADPKTVVRINDLKLEANEQIMKVKYGRYVLYFLSVMNLLYGFGIVLIAEGGYRDWTPLLGVGFVAGLYLAAAGITYRRVVPGLLFGLSLYVLDHGLVMMEDPTKAFEGLLVKIGILTGFGVAILGWYRLATCLQQLRAVGVPEEELSDARKLRELPRTPQG